MDPNKLVKEVKDDGTVEYWYNVTEQMQAIMGDDLVDQAFLLVCTDYNGNDYGANNIADCVECELRGFKPDFMYVEADKLKILFKNGREFEFWGAESFVIRKPRD